MLIRKIGNFFSFLHVLKEYYDYSLFSTCTESSRFLRKNCDCKAVDALDIFEKLL